MLTDLQYRLLKKIAPREPAQMDGSAYANRSKLAVLLGEELFKDIRDKVVIDFGCGEGAEAVELITSGAREVIGIDIRESVLEIAKQRAESAGVSGRCHFAKITDRRADVIVSIDSFEHFGDPEQALIIMQDLLAPGGLVVTAFGPTWFHPLGGHLFSVFPWAHLVFSERALMRWRSDIRSDGATKFSEVEGGLNQMTIARFEQIVRKSNFQFKSLEAVPIRKLKSIHSRLTREFTTAIVRAVLQKRSTPNAL